MKKYLSLILLLVFIGFVAGCQSKPKDSGLNEEMIQDVNVRRAISLAIDKAFYTDDLANGSYPADYFIPYDFYAYEGVDFRDGAAAKYPDLTSEVYTSQDGTVAPSGYNHYDVAEAKRLWNAAKEQYGVGDKTVTFDLLVHSAKSWESLYEHVKAEVEKNLPGAIINIETLTFGEKLKKQQTGDYDIIFSGWGPDYQDPITFLDLYLSDSGQNNINYNNETYDQLIKDSKNAVLTGEERFNALLQAEKILLNDDVVVMPIFQSNAVSLENSDILNLWGQKVGPDYFYKWVESNKTKDGAPEKTLNLLETSNIPDLKSWTTTDQVSFGILGSINEGLIVGHNPKGNTPYVEGMATSWENTTNLDGTVTYTFYLKEQQPWVTSDGEVYAVDGQPQYVKAQDFEFAWKMLGDPREASQYSYMLETAGITGAVDVLALSPDDEDIESTLNNLGVNAVDDYTLEVTLDHDSTYFLGLMSFPSFYPVNEEFYLAQGTDDQGMTKYAQSQHPESVLYNGAFYFSDWVNDEKNVISKNTHYWDVENVDLDQVVWLVKPNTDPSNEVNMYLQGQIDRAVLRDAANQTTYASRADAKTGGTVVAWYLEFNIANH